MQRDSSLIIRQWKFLSDFHLRPWIAKLCCCFCCCARFLWQARINDPIPSMTLYRPWWLSYQPCCFKNKNTVFFISTKLPRSSVLLAFLLNLCNNGKITMTQRLDIVWPVSMIWRRCDLSTHLRLSRNWIIKEIRFSNEMNNVDSIRRTLFDRSTMHKKTNSKHF